MTNTDILVPSHSGLYRVIETLCQNLSLLNESFTGVSAESRKCRTTIQSAKETMESELAKIT